MMRPSTWLAVAALIAATAATAALLAAWLAPENVADWMRLSSFCG